MTRRASDIFFFVSQSVGAAERMIEREERNKVRIPGASFFRCCCCGRLILLMLV